MRRPLKFPTPDDLEQAIENYLSTTEFLDLTVTGLALSIGSSRVVLNDYEKRDGYTEIVQRAKCIIEHSYEVSLRKFGRTGDIFALKNFGWKDRDEPFAPDLPMPESIQVFIKTAKVVLDETE